jgi:endoglucanase Acf2
MQKLIQILGCGGLSLYSGEKLAINLVVSKFADINTKIISLIKKYPLQSSKRLEFGDFCLVVEQMINKAHLTKEVLEKIKEIKARMNTRRELFLINTRKRINSIVCSFIFLNFYDIRIAKNNFKACLKGRGG